MAHDYDIDTLSVQMTVSPTTITTVPDPDSYDKGYDAGHEAGRAEGFTAGKAEGYTEGHETGHTAGYTEGHGQGVAEGVEAGKKAEYDSFWDTYQKKGARTDYRYAFWNGDTWDFHNFKPKYDIKPENATNMLYNMWIGDDLEVYLAKTGVVLDFSRCTTATNCFAYSSWTRVGTLDCSKLVTAAHMCNNSQLATIEKLIFSASTFIATTAFNGCSKLANITAEGTICCDLTFSACPLTAASMKSIIEHLYNYTGSTNANKRTIKFSSTCWTKLNSAEAPPDGYADWQQYVTDGLKWLV